MYTYQAIAKPTTATTAALREPRFLEAAPAYGDEDDPGAPGVLVPDGRMGEPVAEVPAPIPPLPVGTARPVLPVAVANPVEAMMPLELDQ